MEKKQGQRGNIILIITIIILISGFFLINNFIFLPFIEKIQKSHLNQVKQMNEQTQKIIDQGFDFNIFSRQQFMELKEYLALPLKIDNQGNPEPFKQAETNSCTGYTCPQ